MTEKQAFFEKYAEQAIQEQVKYGIPASVTLTQMWFESGGGTSDVALKANNYFGIKDREGAKVGRPVYIHNDRDEKNAPFRIYRSPEDSMRGHSEFLMKHTDAILKRKGYGSLHNLSPTDYREWLIGIQRGGYATNPRYASELIKDIEHDNNREQLLKYDQMAVQRAKAQGVKCGYAWGQKGIAATAYEASSRSNVYYGMPLRNDNTLVVTSDFGHRDISYGSKNHKGIDFRAAAGTDVYGTEVGGIVVGCGYQGASGGKAGGGNYVYVAYPRKDGSYDVTGYLHLSTVDVKVGDRVTAETCLGKSGGTGGVSPHLDFRVFHVSDKQADELRSRIDKGLDGYSFSPSAAKAPARNPKEYLAEVAVAGGLDTKVVKAGDKNMEDVLMAYREEARQKVNDDYLLAENLRQEDAEEQRDHTVEDDIERTVKSNGAFSALLGNDGSGLSQIFQGGSDITSSMIQLLMMSFLALAFNQADEEEQQEQQKTVDEQKNAVRSEEYNARHQPLDAKAMQDMATMQFDIDWSEQQGQGISQGTNRGVSTT